MAKLIDRTTGEVHNNPALYTLVDIYRAFLSESGETSEEDTAYLDSIEDIFDVKAENVAAIIRQLEGEAEMFKAEADRLAKAAKTRSNRVEWLKEYLKASMEALGRDRITSGFFTLALQKNSQPTCEIVNPEIAEKSEFAREVVTITVDKRAVSDHWKQTGETPEGFRVTQGRHLVIRH